MKIEKQILIEALHPAIWTTCLVLSPAQVPFAQQAASNQRQAVYIGFIEDDRRELAKKNDSGPSTKRVIIPAFAQDESGWKAIRTPNKKITWTVAFDGRALGEVESQPDAAPEVIVQPNPVESSGYVYAVHAILTQPSKVPSIGQPSGKFDGAFGGIVRRPLVVISRPHVQDPDHWKPTTLPTELVQPIRVEFRQAYPHVRQCDAQGEPVKTDWNFSDSEVKAVRTYGSNKGSFLVETQLESHRCVFDTSRKEPLSLEGTQWFYLDPQHVAHTLGTDLQLVDAGDYDDSGKSEVIFFFGNSDSDEEGYILFYDNLQKKVTASWTY